MDLVSGLIDFILHLDAHLVELLRQYGIWLYGIVFFIIFAETGFVVTPWLPGDSLLFALGALAAVDDSGTLSAPLLTGLLLLAAVLGNSVNYAIGRWLGQAVYAGHYRFIKVAYLRRTEEYFARYGAMTIVIARFIPIVRTFAPFVAGIGRMAYLRFQAFNLVGAAAWIGLLLWAGYFFGNVPLVKNNFGIVTLLIIVASLVPLAFVVLRRRSDAPVARD
ncbi:MAG: DedA family protein [Steroidobacteraceae bacterium]